MIKLIIFDWDDVITLGAKKGYFACYHKALSEVGVFLTAKEESKRIIAKWGKSYKEEIKELLKEHTELIDSACKIYDREYWGDTFISCLSILPDLNELLIRLSKNYILAVASGNRQNMLVDRIMPKFNIPNIFSQIITSHDIEDQQVTKPHPYMLETIIKTQEVTASETVFVGDAITDVQMAYNARVTPIVVLTGNLTKKKAKLLKVKHIIENVTLIENELNKLEFNSQESY